MPKTTPEQNKALVLEAFNTLFNKRDYEAAKRYWSPTYIQHSAHIEPGRGGLFKLVRSAPPTLKYEPGLIVARGLCNCSRPIQRSWFTGELDCCRVRHPSFVHPRRVPEAEVLATDLVPVLLGCHSDSAFEEVGKR